jgi:hypothetical protein
MKLRITNDKELNDAFADMSQCSREIQRCSDTAETYSRLADEDNRSGLELQTRDQRWNSTQKWAHAENRLFILRVAQKAAREKVWKRSQKIERPVQAALDAVNGKAVSFTISSWHALVAVAECAEKLLKQRGVATKSRNGAVCTYRPAGPQANAYKYDAISTTVEMTRGSTGWFLTGCDGDSVSPRQKEKFVVAISLAARDQVIAHAMIGLAVLKGDTL